MDDGTATRARGSLRAGRRLVLRGLFVLLVLGAASLLGGKRTAPAPAFDLQALGASQRQLPSVRTSAFTATVGARGYTAGTGKAAVSVAAAGAGHGAWRRHAHGVVRTTAYGHETITLAADAVEQLSTVDRHLGTKTWRWWLRGLDLNPRLSPDGSVWFGSGIATHIAPVAIFDRNGTDVTPAGLRWSLRRSGGTWLLELELDDAGLPLPYLIDPQSVSGVTATATSLAAGAKANWSFGFSTANSAGSALGAGDTISVGFPTWTGGAIPAAPSVALTSPATFAAKCTATAATVGTTVTIVLADASGQTCALAKGTAATFDLLGITNTTTTGAQTFSITTSQNTAGTTASPPTIVAPASPAATISFAGSTQAAAAVATWTVGFRSSATNGALGSGSTITVGFPAGFAVAGAPVATLGTGFSGCSVTGATGSGSTATITIGDSGAPGSCSLPAGTQTSVAVGGVTNATAGSYTNTGFTVKTLSDSVTASPAGSVTIAAQTTAGGVSVTASNRAAAATSVTYTASLTPSTAVTGPPPTSGALAAGDTITVALPAGTTVPAWPTITPTAGFSHCSLTSSGLSATVVVTLANSGGACALAAGTSGTFTIAGVTNAAAGSYTPTIRSSVDQTAVSAASLVLFGVATQVAFTTQPSGATGGTAFTTQPVVTIQDSGGRTVANNSSSVTVSIKAGTGTAGAALSGTATVSAVNGVATFGGLSIDKAGASYQLHATDGVLTAGDSAAFTVSVGAAAKLGFSQQPSSSTGGTPFATQPKLTVQDAGGNTVTSDTSTLTLTIGTNPGPGTLSGCSSSETNGVFTLSGCKIDKTGNGYTLHATDGALTSADSATFNITTGPASQLTYTSNTAAVASGSTKSLTVAVQDAGGNTVATDNTTIVVFTQTAGTGSLTGLATATAASGIATLTVTGNIAGPVTIQAAKQAGGLTTPTSTFSVTPGPVSTATSTIGAGPASITANGSSTTTITVQAEDAAGNNLTAGGSSVTLSTTDGTFPSSCTASCVATDNGNGTYTLTLTSSTTAHNVTVSGKIGGSSIASTASVTFAPGPISTTTSTITPSPSTITADGSTTSTITVRAKDANGNALTAGGSTIKLSTTGGTFPSACTIDCTATDNGNGTYTLTLTSSTTAGGVTVSGKVGAAALAQTTGVTFASGVATQLVFTTQPASATAGSSFGQQPVVKVEDANGNVVTSGGDSSVGITMAAGGLQGTTTVAASGGVASFADLRLDTSGAHTITAGTTLSIAGVVNRSSAGFNVAPAAASRLVLTGSAGQTAGGSQTITLTATDPYGNTDTNFTGNKNITLSGATPSPANPGPATNPTARDRNGLDQDFGTTTSLNFTNGHATTLTKLYNNQTANLAAADSTDSINPSTGSDRLTTTVSTAAPSKLAFTAQPGGTVDGGSAFGTQPVVAVFDAYGNLAAADTSSVTLAIANGTGAAGAVLGGPTTVAASAGSASFSGLRIDKAGTGYALTATDGSLTSAVSSSFDVNVGPAVALVLSTQPSGATGGSAFGTQPVVDVVDAGGNRVTGDSSAVTLAIKAGTGTGGAVLAGTTTVGASAGRATFSGLAIDTSGTSYELRATDGSLAAADSSAFDVTVGAAARLVFTTSPSNSTGGTAFATQPVVEVEDAGGNRVTGDGSAISLAIKSGTGSSGAALNGTATVIASSGVATFSGLSIDRSGTGYQLRATSGSLTGADSSTFDLGTGAVSATVSTVFATPTSAPGDGTTSPTITVKLTDGGGNPVGGKTVTLSQGAGHSSISAPSGPSDSSGVVTFTVTDASDENVIYTATDSTDATTLSQTALVAFSPIDANASTVSSSPSSVVADGSATSTITVTVEDGANIPFAGKTVTLSQGTGHSTISAASGLSNASGVVTFTVKSTVAEQVTYTATAAGVALAHTAQVTFTPGPADHVTVTSSGASVPSGSGKTITAEIRDVNGNLETGDNSTVVTFAKTSGKGNVTGLGSATASGGVAHLDVTGQNAGAVTITASTSGLTGDSSGFSVIAGAPDHLTFTGSGANVASGSTKALTVEVRDAAGNLETGDNSTVVTFAKTSGTGIVTGLGSAAASGGVAGLTVTGQTTGPLTVSASKSGLASDSSTFTVDPGPADHLTFTSDSSSVASGSTKTLTVEVRDAAGNLETGDNTTVVTFAKTSGAGSVTGLGSATATGGVASLDATGRVAGALGVTASKSGLTSDNSTFAVTVGPADHLTFTSSSTNVASGSARALTVEVRDAAGNLETGDNSTVVTFAKSSGPGTLTGLGSATATGGVAGLSVSGQTAGAVMITASKPGLASDSSSFAVDPGAADHLTFTSDSSSVASGSAKTLTAEVRDAAGNLETGDDTTVVGFAKTGGTGTVTGLGTAPAAGGIVTLNVSGHTVGAVTITASKTGLTSDASSFAVTVGSADHVAFTSDGSSVASGSAKTLTAEVLDAAGNLETGDNTTVVTFAKTSGTGTVTGLGTANAAGGVATLNVSGHTVGAVTITASKTGLTSDASSFAVTVGPADHLAFTSSSTSVASGSAKTLTAEVRDAAGNLETGDNTTVVTFAGTSGSGTVTGLGSATANGGVAGLTVTGETAGSLTVTASKSGLASDSSTFSVAVGPADHLTVTSDGSSVASGAAKSLSVEVRDAAGNLETGDNSTVVAFAETAGPGTVTGLGTATAAGGIASLGITGNTVGAVTITASKSGLTSDDSTFTVTVGPADHLTLTSSSASLAFGATKALTAEVRDAAGNLETGDNATTVTFAKSAGTGTVTGLGTATASAGVATLNVSGQTAGPVTITASKSGMTSDSSTFAVTAGSADHLTFTSSSANVASGSAKALTVELRDAAGNLETGDNSTVVTFAKTSGAGSVTGLGTATAAGGIASLGITGNTVGAVTITASKAGLTSDGSTFTVIVGPADHLIFTSSSSDLVAGGTRNLTAEIVDTNGNLVDDNSTQVTFGQSGSGTVTGLGTATAAAGSTGLTVTGHTAGTITVTAHAAGLAPDATSSFTVLPGTIDPVVSTVTAASATTSTDAGNTNTVTVTVADGLGNAIASAPVTLTQGAGHSTIAPSGDAGATGSATTNVAGVATFTVSDGTVEGVVYSATASGTPITQTAGVTYTVGVPTRLAFGQQPTNVGVGQAIVPPVTVSVLDSHDNLAATSGAAVTIAIHTNPAGGTLSGGGAVGVSGGIAGFTGLSIDKVGSAYTLDATSPGLAPTTSNPFDVLAAPGLTLSSFSGNVALDSGNSHRAYFRSGGSGWFVLTATPGGEAAYSFPTLSGWTGTQGTGANLNSITYSYSGSPSGGTGLAVTYNDGSADSGPTQFDVVDDSTKPTGGSISAPATAAAASVTLATTDFADSGSGIAANVITRSNGQAPSGGVCPASGYGGATAVTNPDNAVLSGECYVYTLTGTDEVGNSDSVTSQPVLVDTSAPTNPAFVSISAAGTSQYYSGSGTTVYFHAGAGNTDQFTLTASSSDAQSGVTYSFPHISGFTETPGAAPGEERYVAAGPAITDGGTGTVTSTNGVGTQSAGGFSFTIVVDASGPTGGAFTAPAATTYSTDGHATVVWIGFSDGGSGMSTLSIRRQLTTLAGNVCDTANFADDGTFAVTLTTASTSLPAETGLSSGKCYRYVTTATDHVGNVTTRTSNPFLVDSTPPATPTLTALTDSGVNVFVSGSTVYFQPGADNTNTFTVTAATSGDAETGVDAGSWAFAAVPGFTAASPAGSATETYTASSPTALQGGTGTVTVDDNAGLSSAAGAAFTVVADKTAPTGGSFSGVPQYSSDGNVSFSLTQFGDTASGIAAQTVQRQSVAASGNSCPAAGWTNDGPPAAPMATFSANGLADGTCYRWLYDAADNVGNAATTVIGGPTLVDTSGPSAPAIAVDNLNHAYLSGSTIYYNPSTGGVFRVTATSNASASGIASYTFNESTLLSHGFHRGNNGNTAVISFNVSASDTVGTVTATSNSGVTSPATSFSLVGDGTGPAAPTVSCSPCTSNNPVSVSLADNSDGGGSGVKEIRYTTDGSDPTASSNLYTGPFLISSSSTVKSAAVDNLDNLGPIATQDIDIDATPPHATSTDVSGSSMNIHFDKLLVPSEIPAAGAFAVSVTANGTTVADNVTGVAISGATVTLTLATPVSNAQTASVAYTKPGSNQLQDSLANLVGSFSQTATLDVTAPAVLGAAASGTTFTLQFDEPLNGSAVPAASAFAVTMNAGGSPTSNAVTGVAVSGSTLTLTLGSSVTGFQSVAAAYVQPASNRLADLAGNEAIDFTKTVSLDTTAPHATAAEVTGNTLTVHFDEALASSTPAGSAFSVSLGGLSVPVTGVSISGSDVTLTLGAAAVGGQSASLTYTPPATGRLQDAATNATPGFTLSPSNLTGGGTGGTPTFTSATPADGTTQAAVSGPVVLSANENVTWSNVGVTYIDFAGDTGNWQPIAGGTAQNLSLPLAAAAPGLYTIRGTVGDGVTSTDFITHFTVWSGSAGLPRPTAKTALSGSGGTLATADQKATFAWPATDIPTGPKDGLIVETAPRDPATIHAPQGTAWAAGVPPVDVTAHTILSNTPVTSFTDPILITFATASPTDAPMVSPDKGQTWRFISPCASPGVMQSGSTDCYAFVNGVVSVWTLHLTLFALADDHQAPSAPQKLGVGVSGGQIVMRWEPATDNSGRIDRYSILVDGQVVKVLGGETYEYYLGPATPGDTHVYRVQATDESGNTGPLSDAYTGVPDLHGLSEQQARDVLASRGFSVGAIGRAGSGGFVGSQNPSAPGYAQVGSAVDFALSTTVQAPLALHVVGTKHVDLEKLRYTAIRIQLNKSATVAASLRSAGHVVAEWTRPLDAGTWIIRYALPRRISEGSYKLTVAATSAGERRASTIRLRLEQGRTQLGGRARVVVVAEGSRRNTLGVSLSKAKVLWTQSTNVWDTTFWSRNVAVVVVDIDGHGLALVHNLHTVFPTVRMVAVTKDPAKALAARRFGAAAVVVVRPGGERLVSATVSSLLGRL